MPEFVHLTFLGFAYVADPFGVAFPTRADACAWLTGHGYEPQDTAGAIWALSADDAEASDQDARAA